jgi:3-oxoacyl-(acyl-carrier-protein) synthase
MRVIQRGNADVCFCGGLETKMNPMSFLRQQYTGRISKERADDPTTIVRPFDEGATGCIVGEGGAIVVVEEEDAFVARHAKAAGDAKPTAYARLVGFGASQTLNPARRNIVPDEHGVGIELAISRAIKEAGIAADEIDLIVPFGIGHDEHDIAEANALVRVFGEKAGGIPVASTKPFVGICGAGVGGLDVAIAAMAVHSQVLPPAVNCESPRNGLNATTRSAQAAEIRHALAVSTGLGGQNAAVVLGRVN